MPTQAPIHVSRAHRWAYACGMSLKRGYRWLKEFESRVAERAVSAGIPAGKGIVRGSFLVAKLALIGGLLFVSLWLAISIVILIVLFGSLVNAAPIPSKNALRYKAYGDPYGEYEFGRAPGQPDLKDL
ncbi:hypothetical protein PS862_00035 [Pseudomonas fluorescens]|uniref:DUF3742 domain-containing protein n=1 Tax=Pseudomonas fluorescens TaxID=294 RepID=A0A5E7G1I5_PSEFL|nr:DUF3742 family protein [Pseudomonas fluorescens]VVO45791.1 hypothetical protein PS862_00035 [Pseudomonas fluorescens]